MTLKIRPIDLNEPQRQGLFADNIILCMEKINELAARMNDLCDEVTLLNAKIRTLERGME